MSVPTQRLPHQSRGQPLAEQHAKPDGFGSSEVEP